jgi:hypothetical protein
MASDSSSIGDVINAVYRISCKGSLSPCEPEFDADQFERRAVLTAVKTASRRLRRWPAASLDRRCARRSCISQVGTEKRHLIELRNFCPSVVLSISSAWMSADTLGCARNAPHKRRGE